MLATSYNKLTTHALQAQFLPSLSLSFFLLLSIFFYNLLSFLLAHLFTLRRKKQVSQTIIQQPFYLRGAKRLMHIGGGDDMTSPFTETLGPSSVREN